MKSKSVNIDPEFHRPMQVEKIPPQGMVEKVEANKDERTKLAKRFDLLDLPKLQAELTLSSVRAGAAIAVQGTIMADVVQRCVITLEPVPSHIENEINVLFAFEDKLAAKTDPSQVEMDDEDIEFILDGRIDLGELVAQHLGISLDPYPKKPGVVFAGAEFGETKAMSNPFIKLVDLKKKPTK